jgi:hypothetical protein
LQELDAGLMGWEASVHDLSEVVLNRPVQDMFAVSFPIGYHD